MPIEIHILGWSCLLLMVHILWAGNIRTKQYGVQWNMGARDENLPPISPLGGRLIRAQANFLETYPIAIILLLSIVITGKQTDWTAIGGGIWLAARIIYLPLYAMGIPKIRTLTYLVSMVGLVIVFVHLMFM